MTSQMHWHGMSLRNGGACLAPAEKGPRETMAVHKDTRSDGGERVRTTGTKMSGRRALKFNFMIFPRIQPCLGLAVLGLIPSLVKGLMDWVTFSSQEAFS